ncbi:MAG: hypothetical protein WC701_06920 [Kiritimatiellales bacterium]|jgi:hypothetical protein
MIDGLQAGAYVATVMNARFYRGFVLLTAVAACAVSSFAEDLDAALAAQKKKAQHRVYSESALLDDQKLVVPRTPTQEEQELDKKLQELEAKADVRPDPRLQHMMLRQSDAAVRPAEKQNWLTPAMLDNDASVTQTNETDNAWLVREMERQKELKELEAAKKENEQVEKLLRGKTQQQQKISPEMDRLKQYQLAPPKLFGSKEKDDDPPYMTPRSGTPNPLSAVGLTPKKEIPVAPAPFSPKAARISSAMDNDPLKSVRNPALSITPGLLSQPSRSVFSPNRDVPAAVPLTPLEMIRKSSPINRPDPFTDDHMPRIKSSIWE